MVRVQSEPQEEQSLKARLDAMPKKSIHIPDDDNNPGDVVPIGWNGITYAVPRGIEFQVPEVIADIWQNSYSQTQKAKRKMTITENKEIAVFN
jgi:hypothetical protein